MARIDAKEADVLERFRAYLQAQLSLNAQSCFLTVSPLAYDVPPGGNYFVSVSPMGGSYDQQQLEGGMATYLAQVGVTIYSRIKLDRADHDASLLTDATRGLLVVKQLVLKALANVDLAFSNGNTFGRHHIWPNRDEVPQYSKEDGVGWQTMIFDVSWDWDLT